MILTNANDLAKIINYDHNHSFIVLATVITIVNYDHKTFIVQATCLTTQKHYTCLERHTRDKRSSLLRTYVNSDRKSFVKLVPD
jgi:hypothetical protein